MEDSKSDCRIDLTEVDNVQVSTVFLGLNHNFSEEGDPILFETMVFNGEYDQEMERYCTYDEAVAGHKKWCDIVFSKKPDAGSAVLGGNNRVDAAVLGGIEGARQRLRQAKTPEESLAAIEELVKYDPRIASGGLDKKVFHRKRKRKWG